MIKQAGYSWGSSGHRTFADALEIEIVSPTTFSARPRAGSPGRAFGGELVSEAILAATATVEVSRSLHSAHVQFVAPARAHRGVTFEVDRVRDGRTFSARTVTATQDGRTVLVLIASFQKPEDGFDHQIPTLDVPLPEAVPDLVDQLADDPETLAWTVGIMNRHAVQLRFPDGPGRSFVSRGQIIPPRQRIWMRVTEQLALDERSHAAVLAGITDLIFLSTALFPHGLTAQSAEVEFASLNHTIWVHRRFLLDDWVLFDQFSDWAGAGRGLCHGRVLDRSGALLATVSQEGMMRRSNSAGGERGAGGPSGRDRHRAAPS